VTKAALPSLQDESVAAKVGDMSKSTARDTGSRTKVGRASRSLGQSWQVPIFLIGTLVFGIVAASAPLRRDADAYEFACDLHQLREALQGEDSELGPLQYLAESLLLRQAKYTSYSGEVEYLVGSLHQRQAQQSPPEQVRELYAQAIKHLQRSLTVGAPRGDEPVLLFQLSQCYYESGELTQAIEYVEKALTRGFDRRAAAYGLLVQAYLHLPEPDLEKALSTNQKQMLEFSDEEALAAARLSRGQILIKKGDYEEAYKTLERINSQAPRALLAEARYLQTECCEKEGWWDKAMSLWQELLDDPSKVPGGKARVLYSLGLAHRHATGGEKQAEKAWSEAFKMGGEIGQAAGLRLGELHLLTSKSGAEGALQHWAQALLGIKTPRDYQNKLVELSEARKMFEDAFHVLAQDGDFTRAQELALLYQRLAVPGEADEKLADATEALARGLLEKAAAPTQDSEALRQTARTLFEKAALAYEVAAATLPFDRQPKVLWRCAQCFLRAGDHARAVPILDRFVRVSPSDGNLAEAWLALGQSYQALNQREMARQAYYKCIELPASTSSYEARYQIAEEQLQLGKLDEAIDNLTQCLNLLTPSTDRAMRERALFKLANALYLRKDYDKAHLKLKDAALLFPNNPEVLSVRDRLGECYRKLSEKSRDNAKGSISEVTKQHYQNEMREWLTRSLQIYLALVDELEHKVLSDPEEEKLLRKAGFMVADLNFELSAYPEALQRYRKLQDDHRSQFAGLVACLRIWRCVGVMVSTPDQAMLAQKTAREALQLAQEDLAGMPDDHEAFRDRPGGWGKQEWQDWVNRTREQLGAGSAPPPPAPMAAPAASGLNALPPPLPN